MSARRRHEVGQLLQTEMGTAVQYRTTRCAIPGRHGRHTRIRGSTSPARASGRCSIRRATRMSLTCPSHDRGNPMGHPTMIRVSHGASIRASAPCRTGMCPPADNTSFHKDHRDLGAQHRLLRASDRVRPATFADTSSARLGHALHEEPRPLPQPIRRHQPRLDDQSGTIGECPLQSQRPLAGCNRWPRQRRHPTLQYWHPSPRVCVAGRIADSAATGRSDAVAPNRLRRVTPGLASYWISSCAAPGHSITL